MAAGTVVFYAGSFMYTAGLHCMLFTVESATVKVKLFTKEEAQGVVEKLKGWQTTM